MPTVSQGDCVNEGDLVLDLYKAGSAISIFAAIATHIISNIALVTLYYNCLFNYLPDWTVNY